MIQRDLQKIAGSRLPEAHRVRFGSQATLFRHSSLMSAFGGIADSWRPLFQGLPIERLLSPIAVVQLSLYEQS